MKFVSITLEMIWVTLLLFNGAFSTDSYAFQTREDSKIYFGDGKNEWLKPSRVSNEYKSSPTRRKRQVEVRMNGIRHVYESPQNGYDNQNPVNSQEQMNLWRSFPGDLQRQVASSNLNSQAQTLSQNPMFNLEQGARQSFDGNMIEKFNETPRQVSSVSDSLNYKNTNNFQSASDLPNSFSKDVALQSQMEDSQMNTRDIEQLRSDSGLGNHLYNKDEMFNIPQIEEGNSQSYSPSNFHKFPNLPSKDRSLISTSQTEDAIMPHSPESHFSPNFNHHHFDDPHIVDVTSHSLIHTSHVREPPFVPPTPHIEPVIHPDSGPQVINALGPDNIHIIKKFYPLPVVQKVPKPVPVVETRPVPYPVHQKLFHYVPQPYPQPFSKPDLHLSYIHMEHRGKCSIMSGIFLAWI